MAYNRANIPQKQESPICSFPKLKDLLEDMGIKVGKAEAYTSVGTVNVKIEDIGTRILFEDDKIYYIDDDGIKRRGFMYKAAFYFEWEGIRRQPKFHVCRCQTIANFGRDAYRFANAEPIKIIDRSKRKEVEVEGMELCGYCRRMLIDEEARRVADSTDFVQILKEAGEVEEIEDIEQDFYGYVRNWEQISTAYRSLKHFTCERCGICIDAPFDRQFIHTHHKNGDKTNNKETNLECLCIECHSKVDNTHRENFSKGGNKFLLNDFKKKYKKIRTEEQYEEMCVMNDVLATLMSQSTNNGASGDDLPF